MALLSDAEVRQYHEQGYLVPMLRLPVSMVDGLRDALDRLLRDNPGVRPEKLVSAHLARSDGRANDEGVRGQADFLALAQNTQILDAVEQLIGPDIILWGCNVFCTSTYEECHCSRFYLQTDDHPCRNRGGAGHDGRRPSRLPAVGVGVTSQGRAGATRRLTP